MKYSISSGDILVELSQGSIQHVESPGQGPPGAIMPTIEVIEDDLAMRTLIAEWLRAEGYRVHAESRIGDERKTDVDLVVVNLGNLHVNGIETVRRVRGLYAKAALIGVSTHVSRTLAADSSQALHLGLAGLVSKPFRSSELLSAVVGAIGPAA